MPNRSHTTAWNTVNPSPTELERGCPALGSLGPPHHHGRAGAGHRPAEVGRHFGVPDLAAAALAVVVGVAALAVRSDRAGIIDVVAQLPDVLHHHVDAVGVALAQVPARGVVRPLAAELDGAVADVSPAFALLAEAVILQL